MCFHRPKGNVPFDCSHTVSSSVHPFTSPLPSSQQTALSGHDKHHICIPTVPGAASFIMRAKDGRRTVTIAECTFSRQLSIKTLKTLNLVYNISKNKQELFREQGLM